MKITFRYPLREEMTSKFWGAFVCNFPFDFKEKHVTTNNLIISEYLNWDHLSHVSVEIDQSEFG